MEWHLKFPQHNVAGMSREIRDGRNPYEGYVRACGLQFGNAAELCAADPDFLRAIELIGGPPTVDPYKLMNLFMLFKFFLPNLPATGSIAEFGTYQGGSCIFMAYLARRFLNDAHVYGFDTFTGMPPTDRTIDMHREGEFGDVNLDGLQRHVAQQGLTNLTFIKGLFEDTLPSELPKLGPMRLIHIDCDIYSAVAYCYNTAKHTLVPGGYVVLDDPLTSTCLGAFAAVEDHIIRGDNLHAEQVSPHLVFRYPKL